MSSRSTYMDYFDLSHDEYVPCEICGARGIQVHHISYRSHHGKKTLKEQENITNLMMVCYKCHKDIHDHNKYRRIDLQEIHDVFLRINCPCKDI